MSLIFEDVDDGDDLEDREEDNNNKKEEDPEMDDVKKINNIICPI